MLDPGSLSELGLLGLFLAAFLAGSLAPFPSEVVLVAILGAGVQPPLAVGVATAGNVLGALSVYGIGWLIARGGRVGERLRQRWADDPERLERARRRLERWGTPALVLAWIPILGDVLVLAAGLMRLRLAPVLVWVTLGKAGRYAVIAWSAVALG